MKTRRTLIATLPLFLPAPNATGQGVDRPRARDLGVDVGIFPLGPWNAIDQCRGRVGWTGARVNTGVTAIRPHPRSIYHKRVPAAIYVGNGFGKLLGVTQVRELGELETPILLTCTLYVWKAADAVGAGAEGYGKCAIPIRNGKDGGGDRR